MFISKIFFTLATLFAGSQAFAQTALVIIDMQPHFSEKWNFIENPQNDLKIKQVLSRQLQLIDIAKAHGIPILLIEYKGCGSTHADITNALNNYKFTRCFLKKQDGMFDEFGGVADEIKTYLKFNNIIDLVVVGANGGACVRCSIVEALLSNYNVWSDENGVIDFNYEDFVYPYRFRPSQIAYEYELQLLDENFHQPEDASEIENLILNSKPLRPESTDCEDLVTRSRFDLFKKKIAQILRR